MQHYYTSEAKLKLKEYGRTIQNMVDYAKTLPNRRERNALVREIIRMMALLNPNLRENPDYKQKLWDDLWFLADFEIDIDAEFPMPPPESVHSRPAKRMPYSTAHSRFRQYGHTVDLMIEKAIAIQDPAERKALVTIICNIMKFNIKGNDRDSTVEETVLQHLNVISNGKLRYTVAEINFSKMVPSTLPGANSHKIHAQKSSATTFRKFAPQPSKQNFYKKKYKK